MKTRILALALMASPLFAQLPTPTFTAVYEGTKSAAAAVSSLQQAATPAKSIVLVGIQMYCSVACTVSLEAAGAATGSVSSIASTSPGQTGAATARFYADSNAAAATVPINKYVILAGTTQTAFFTDPQGRSTAVLSRSPGQNFTLRSTAVTGDVKYTWLWREE